MTGLFLLAGAGNGAVQKETADTHGASAASIPVKRLSADSAYRTGIHACTAINAGVGRDVSLAAVFADGVYRTGFVAGTAVDALVRNFVSQCIHLLRFKFLD